MDRRSLLFVGFCATWLVTLAMPVAAWARFPSGTGGTFFVVCRETRDLQVDPIVSPGAPQSAHLHTFFGHQYIDQNSTPSGILGGATRCRLSADSSGYWVPTAYRTDTGAEVVPRSAFAYYLGTTRKTEEHFPAGTEMVGGDSHATGPTKEGQHTITTFLCEGGKYQTLPYDCRPFGGSTVHFVQAITYFPYCWNGQRPSDYHNFSYGNLATGACTIAPYTHRIPQLKLNVKYVGFQRGDLMTFSSGNGYTFHADWMDGWRATKLNKLVDGCINRHKQCPDLTDKKPGP